MARRGWPRSPLATRLLAAALAAQVVAGLVALTVLTDDSEARRPGLGVLGRPAPLAVDDPTKVRSLAVTDLLGARGSAVVARDRAAFLATVDPGAASFRTRQGRLFDALMQVPVERWSYELIATRERAADPELDRRYPDGWWAPDVRLRYALTGFDAKPTSEDQYLTFVRRGSAWYVGADDDFAARGLDTARGLWDSGAIISKRGRHTLVLGHPGAEATMTRVARAVEDAIPRVSGLWRQPWAGKVVVLVPRDESELTSLVGSPQDLSQIAAVATAQHAPAPGDAAVGDRILINPGPFARLGPVGRRVVLTHEVTHVATRSATGSAAPSWLVEGFADYVGYSGLDVPLRLAAAQVRAAVRAGRVPTALPGDGAFDGGQVDLAASYEQAWLAVRLLARTYGNASVVRFYRAAAQVSSSRRDAAVAAAFRETFGSDFEHFVARWVAELRLLRR
ncbi:MAG TPA: hypothetical protein VNA30_07390 [Mycobacteriales bacterium]|nr:hypothetical protein [Mycobacteriales bacterium]